MEAHNNRESTVKKHSICFYDYVIRSINIHLAKRISFWSRCKFIVLRRHFHPMELHYSFLVVVVVISLSLSLRSHRLTQTLTHLIWFHFFFHLFCGRLQVRLVFNKSVSWVRVRDDHILTVDQITFITDERFHAYHATENGGTQSSATSTLSNQRRQLGATATKTNIDQNNTGISTNSANAPWTLQIKYVQGKNKLR